MNKALMIIFILLTNACLYSQDTVVVGDMITDRPDQTESAEIVPVNLLQVETGAVYELDNTDMLETENITYNNTLLRYGIARNKELRLSFAFSGVTYKFSPGSLDTTKNLSGMAPVGLGIKTLIIPETGILPQIAYLANFSLPYFAGKDFQTEYVQTAHRVAFAHSITDAVGLGYNIGISWDGETPVPWWFYSFSLGLSLTEKLGGFVEGYGILSEETTPVHMADAGVTFSLKNNLQLDVSGGIGISGDAPDGFISAGFSWRIPE